MSAKIYFTPHTISLSRGCRRLCILDFSFPLSYQKHGSVVIKDCSETARPTHPGETCAGMGPPAHVYIEVPQL